MSEDGETGMSKDDQADAEAAGMVAPAITLAQLCAVIYDAREVLAEMADDVTAVGTGPEELMAWLVTRAAGLPDEFRFQVTDAIRDDRTATSVEREAAAWQLGKIQAVRERLARLLAQEEAATARLEESQRTCCHCGVAIVPDPALVSMWVAAGVARPRTGEGGPRPGLCGGTGPQHHEPEKKPQPWIARRFGGSYGVWCTADGGWLSAGGTMVLLGKAEAEATAGRLSGEA